MITVSDRLDILYSAQEELDEQRLFEYLDKGASWLLSEEHDKLYERIKALDVEIEMYDMLKENNIEVRL